MACENLGNTAFSKILTLTNVKHGFTIHLVIANSFLSDVYSRNICYRKGESNDLSSDCPFLCFFISSDSFSTWIPILIYEESLCSTKILLILLHCVQWTRKLLWRDSGQNINHTHPGIQQLHKNHLNPCINMLSIRLGLVYQEDRQSENRDSWWYFQILQCFVEAFYRNG